MTQFIFIGTSGRSGSYGLAQALNLIPGVEAHHQYACVQVQRIGTLYYRGYITEYQAMVELDNIYGAAYRYCRNEWWVDISNKIPWVSSLLTQMYYRPVSAYVVRDGQKVCLSYYHKLPEVYDHKYLWPLVNYLSGQGAMQPPPEERYWWPYAHDCCDDRWEMLCWHWAESYRQALQAPKFKLETLLTGEFQKFLDDLGLPASEEAEQHLLSKSYNEPEMTEQQAVVFEKICGKLYRQLGYTDVPYLRPVQDQDVT